MGPMKIGVVLYGFLNDVNNLNDLSEIFRICNNLDNVNVTFFYSIRKQMSEFNDNLLTEQLITKYLTNQYDFKFNLIDYNVCEYINYANKLNLPVVTNTHKTYTYRTLSLFDSIKNSLSMVDEVFDFLIVTRVDLLRNISNLPLNAMSDIKDKIYLWRTSPYRSCEDAEDRFFWGDGEIIKTLTSLYDNMVNYIYEDNDFYSEKIIGDFIKDKYDSCILFQDGLNIVTKINSSKYEVDTYNKIINLYNNC